MHAETQHNAITLTGSIIVMLFSCLMLSNSFSVYVIQPLVFDGTISKSGRYGFVFEAWDTIEQDNSISVVAIGSSLTQFAINGSCMSYSNHHENSKTYNLGVPGSAPYLDMIQVERAINSNPEVILIELNPISLTQIHSLSEENIELRLSISSLFLRYDDYGDWYDLLEEKHRDYVDGIFLNRYRSESVFFAESLEEMIERYNQSDGNDKWWEIYGHWFSSTPYPNSEEWHDYLIEPTWLNRYLSKLTPEELDKYENVTIPNLMKRDRYNPVLDSNLNFEALDYMVSSFSDHGIPVMLISYPLHPAAMKTLAPNQFDAHNSSIEALLEYDDVTSLNLIWGGNWTRNDFYDYEHLDHFGRQKVCSIISDQLNDTKWN